MARLIIREATAGDYEDVVCFYEENPDEHVMLRNEADVRNAISNGTFFIAIDTEADNNGRICAASAVYDVPSTLDSGGSVLLKEAGGSLTKPNMRGLGLHKVFHAARGLHEYILDRFGFDYYFGAIILPNPPSVTNIEKMGFEPWPEVPRRLVEERAPYALSEEGIGFFRCKEAALQTHANYLLNIQNIGHIVRRDGNSQGEQIEVVLSIETLKRYRPVVEIIAAGDFEKLT